MRMKRVVVFLPMAAVQACDDLAARYGSNRSEVFRLAIAEGMPGTVEALEKLQEIRMVEALGAGASRSWRIRGAQKRPGRGRPRSFLDPDRAVAVLVDYGRAVRAADPGLTEEDLGVSLRSHAQVIGVAADDLEDAVVDAVSRLFGRPQLQSVADPSQPPE